MKFTVTLLSCCLFSKILFAQFNYVNPLPGSSSHHPQTTILLKNGNAMDRESINNQQFVEITGSKSGKHNWTALLSDDDKTIIVKPEVPFFFEETVTVNVHSTLLKENGEKINGITFSFGIRAKTTGEQEKLIRLAKLQNFIDEYGYDPSRKDAQKITYPLDSMPTYTISINNNPAPGRIFYSNHEDQTGPDPATNSFTTIIENNGDMVWAKDVGQNGRDFKLNVSGYLSYFSRDKAMWMILDSNYNLIDSAQCKNGYELSTNDHDVMMYPDGHILLQAYENTVTDMTAYGGLTNAVVQYLVLQELDQNKEVVFEWRSEDHFQFTDANQYTPLTNLNVDYVHGNSVERDFDGNILISCRNMDELTKINRETGEIIWRMGGENNQFTFINDNNVKHFASQHDLRRIENGNITIFNNGNKMTPQVSSAKEYQLDEINKTATLVWYYEHPDVNGIKVYGTATGNAQRLPNGNTMIDWGLVANGVPNQTEVDYNKNIVWEMSFDSIGQKSYRVHKYDWDPCSRITGYTMTANPKPSKTTLSWAPATGVKKYKLRYRPLGPSNWTTVTGITKNKVQLTGLLPSTAYEWQVQTICASSPLKKSPYSELDTFTTPPQKIAYEQNQLQHQVSIFPVPSVDVLNISFEEPLVANITIVNMVGNVMFETEFDSEEKDLFTVNTSSWPAGIYLLKIDDGIHHPDVKKFIKE
ncbi:MAG: arylsulfotransferase family protein [Chitinophagales bacterium]